MNDQRKLYALSKGEGRCNADTLACAASQLGHYAYVCREDRGYSTRTIGGSNKLPDDVYIEFEGERYGSGHANNNSVATRSLQEFAEDIVDRLTGEQVRLLEIDYHVQQLKLLGVVVPVECIRKGESLGGF